MVSSCEDVCVARDTKRARDLLALEQGTTANFLILVFNTPTHLCLYFCFLSLQFSFFLSHIHPSSLSEHDFLHQLEDDPGFANPQTVANLCQLLGLTQSGLRPTLIADLQTSVGEREGGGKERRKEGGREGGGGGKGGRGEGEKIRSHMCRQQPLCFPNKICL